jgi:hypothetical protein
VTRSPSTAAKRMREYRRRRRLKVATIRVRLSGPHIDALINRGYLNPQSRGDQGEIETAASDCIADALFNR